MGKQNFIQGGFTGKVGQLIGARWKDMYIIKANTKPANPKTEKQQANRATFRDRVQSTKLAFQANYDTTLFNSTHVTTWATRMKAASQMYAKNKNILEYCPLIPYGYVPDYPTSGDPEISGNQITLSWDTTDDIGGRVLSVLAWVTNTATQKYEAQLIVATVSGAAGNWTATATLPTGYSFDEDTYIIAISRDSTDAENKVLYQPPVHTGSGIETVVFTLSNPVVDSFAVGDNHYQFSLTASELLPNISNLNVRAVARGVLQGEWVEGTAAAASYASGTTFIIGNFSNLDSLGQRPMFVTGSTLVVPAFSYIADGKRWEYEGGTFNLAETPTTQTLIPESTTVHWTGSVYELTLKSAGSWTIQAAIDLYANTVLDDLTTDNVLIATGQNVATTGLICEIDAYGNKIRWGANQTYQANDSITAISNGITYITPANTTWTIEPQETEMTLPYTLSYSADAIFVANSTSGWVFFEEKVPNNPTIIDTANDAWFDTFEMDWDGITVTVDSVGFNWDIDVGVPTVTCSAALNYPTDSQNTATVHVVNNTTKRAEYTVPNSGGFKFVQQIMPYNLTFTGLIPT